MNKRALFLHGTGGSPSDHWWPWLKEQFEQAGYEVWPPLLPDNERPNAETYWNFLHASGWDFTDAVLVGHSSGATSVLNLLSRPEFPKVSAAVLVGAFLNENLTKGSPDFEDARQFAALFPEEGFNWSVLKEKAQHFYFVHGDNDPYCAYGDAMAAAKELDAELLTIPNGGHLSDGSNVIELPQIVESLQRDNVL